MVSEKRLASVTHNIAHHSMSGVSWIHPHLEDASRDAGVPVVTIDLLAGDPCPDELLCPAKSPLYRGLRSLQGKFGTILVAEGCTIEDVEAATLTFDFTRYDCRDPHSVTCTSLITSADGRSHRHKVDFVGPRTD